MHPWKRAILVVNLLGGVAVLGSYWHGFATAADPGRLWGDVPAWLRPVYTTSMLLAAAGYFPVLWLVLGVLDAERVRFGRAGYGLVLLLYALVLVPSAAWMPLTFQMIARPSPALWIAIRLVLFAVGLGAMGLLVALVEACPRPPARAFVPAVAGQVAFCVQTALLDALVWPAYFPH